VAEARSARVGEVDTNLPVGLPWRMETFRMSIDQVRPAAGETAEETIINK